MEGGAIFVGIPVGTDTMVRAYANKLVEENGMEHLARLLSGMPDKQVATLIADRDTVGTY